MAIVIMDIGVFRKDNDDKIPRPIASAKISIATYIPKILLRLSKNNAEILLYAVAKLNQIAGKNANKIENNHPVET